MPFKKLPKSRKTAVSLKKERKYKAEIGIKKDIDPITTRLAKSTRKTTIPIANLELGISARHAVGVTSNFEHHLTRVPIDTTLLLARHPCSREDQMNH